MPFVYPLFEPAICPSESLLYKMLQFRLLWVHSLAQIRSVPVNPPVYRYSLNKHISTANYSTGLNYFFNMMKILFQTQGTCLCVLMEVIIKIITRDIQQQGDQLPQSQSLPAEHE